MTNQIPNCSAHGVPMTWKTGTSNKTGQPYAFWSCSQKNPDGSYCKAKPIQPQIQAQVSQPVQDVKADALVTIQKQLVEINRKLNLLLPEEKPLPKRVQEPEIPIVDVTPTEEDLPF